MLSKKALQKIEREITKYPENKKQSAIMAALAIAQEEAGWLSNKMLEFLAKYFDMQEIAVQEVATFYSMYNLKPSGKYKLTICTNLPCALSGAESAATYLKKKLGIDYNQVTPCGTFSLKEGECMGSCADAPVVLVNNTRMCDKMLPKKIDSILGELLNLGSNS